MDLGDYSTLHRDRLNLLIHLFAVPLFVLTMLGLIWALLRGQIVIAVLVLIGPVLALALQGLGHKREATAPRPFAGPGDFLRRILREQLIIFPYFLISGGWFRAWRAAAR